ncbi:MAG: hypothetical protein HKN05_20680 [Rhizobiales bacterium]|nr:hypothetical protein [Hyphomicrobiales bacterium]
MTDANDADDAGAGGRGVDIAAGLCLAALSVFALVWLIPAHTQPADSQFDVAPGFFPNLAAGAVLLLSGLLLLRRWGQVPSGGGGARIVLELAVWSALSVAIMLALSHIGFLIMAPVVIAGAMLFSGNRNWWLIAAMTIIFPLVVKWAAWFIFTVDLP